MPVIAAFALGAARSAGGPAVVVAGIAAVARAAPAHRIAARAEARAARREVIHAPRQVRRLHVGQRDADVEDRRQFLRRDLVEVRAQAAERLFVEEVDELVRPVIPNHVVEVVRDRLLIRRQAAEAGK